MSLLDRLFRSNKSRVYNEGLALFEQGRFGEAVVVLRRAIPQDKTGNADSLGGNLLRRSLQAEGRRLLRAGDADGAIPFFAEACSLWSEYPDLQWWHGTALGLAGRWDEALTCARNALRRNPEYPEARLLESAALKELDRLQDAALSLTSLCESGRRQDHWLTRQWPDAVVFAAETLPDDLPELLQRVVKGESEKDQLAAAVALCRAGDWQQGTTMFRELVQRRPRYPDYRTRLAAALFQMKQMDEALAEVEAALALHSGYAAALDLKALILADMQRYGEALEFMAASEDDRTGQNPGSLEALFGAYLRGVLSLLLGRPAQVAELLGRWNDLVHDFAWAELLLGAADHVRGRRQSCGLRLEALAKAWPADPEYAYLLACHYLEAGQYDQVSAVLDGWPPDDSQRPDQRLLFLQIRLGLLQGRTPEISDSVLETDSPATEGEDEVIPRVMPPQAWQMLKAERSFIQGQDKLCWEICRELQEQDLICERSLDIMLQCADGAGVSEDWDPPRVMPASCLTGACALALRRGQPLQARSLLQPVSLLHPEMLTGMFLRPEFWLQSVRRWLS